MSERLHLPRGLVTFLFTDIEGSTRLAQLLGSGYRTVLTEHRRVLHRTVAAGGGTELSVEGDSLFVAFDDAAAALRACAQAQRELAGHGWPEPALRPLVRMGLHTGYAEPSGGEYTSPEVHRAARVAAAAHGDQVVCSAATAARAGCLQPDASLLDLGLHRLRGFDDRQRLYQLVAPGLHQRFPRLRTLDDTPHNLPAPATSFVGRGTELADLAGLIGAHRLVTVLGPGGAGKSRLATEVAGGLTADFPDGIWFVDFAAVTDPGLVAVRVADALGLRSEPGRAMLDTLADHATGRRFLLVLDTCDAQPAAAAMVVNRLLASGRGVRVLVTSREPLGLAGEVVWRIPPMSLAAPADGSPSEAVQLLLARAAAATGTTGRPRAELADLSRVAQRLEGLPLAIELAAARLRVLSPSQLDRQRQPLQPLRHPAQVGQLGALDRHATMQATVTWSYRTLRPRGARLLRWLATFAGRVDLAAVDALMGEDCLDALAVLVDKSLVQAEPAAGGMTYRLLDPIRAYAALQLLETGEEQAARDRHVAWSAAAVQQVHSGPDGPGDTLSMYALDPLATELRAALHWAAGRGSARTGLAIAVGLDQWWRERGLVREGRLWLFRLYERLAATAEEVPDTELAWAYHVHALQAGADGEHAEELRFSERAEAAARRAGDPGLLARVLAGRGPALLDLGEPGQAERSARAAIDWAYRHGVPGDALTAVYCLAYLLWHRGALDEAAELLASARPVEAAQPAQRGGRTVDMLLGVVALRRGDLVAAHDHLVVALRSRIGYGYRSRACETVNAFAVRCALGGDAFAAARLFGAADAARASLRHGGTGFGGYWAASQSLVRSALGDAVFDAAYAQGATLSLEEAATIALAVEHPDLHEGSVRFSAVGAQMW